VCVHPLLGSVVHRRRCEAVRPTNVMGASKRMAELVLQGLAQRGEVFVLDMGEPVKIADLARKMIHLTGLVEKTPDKPEGDIEVVFTGLRPGEKLFEELLIGDDPQGTAHPRIMMAREVSMAWGDLEAVLSKLSRASQEFDCSQIVETLKSAPTGFTPNGNVADLVWCNGGSDLTVAHEGTGKVHRLPV